MLVAEVRWVTATTSVMLIVPLCSRVPVDAMVTDAGSRHGPVMMLVMMLKVAKVLLLSCLLLVPLSRRYVGRRSGRLRPPAG